MSKILHLTLKREWFDMILRGEKKEEYRELKPYWAVRLMTGGTIPYCFCESCVNMYNADNMFCDFDMIRFTNGYSKDARSMDVQCNFITIDYGMLTWGAPEGERVFVILLGDIVSTKNIK